MTAVHSRAVSVLLALFALVQMTFGSLNDPHLFPKNAKPYMEGWYMRIIDADVKISLGVVFGLSAPVDEKPPQGMTKNPGYLGVFFQDMEGEGRVEKMQTFNALVKNERDIYVYGAHDSEKIGVSKNPKVEGNSNFRWCVNSPAEGAVGCFVANPNEDTLQFSFAVSDPKEQKDIVVEALVKVEGRQWNEDGKNYGPMGGWVNLPIPLVWYVHNTRSRVLSYTYQETPRDGKFSTRRIERTETGVRDVTFDAKTGKEVNVNTITHTLGAHAHLEKNWGKMFPEAWIWSQMYDATTENYFAVTYGKLDLPLPVKLAVPAHLIGYRNWKKGISLDFRPDNSHVVSQKVDGCAGTLDLMVRQFLTNARFHLKVRATPTSFSKQFPGPLKYGFQEICVESFSATAEIEVYLPANADIDIDDIDPDNGPEIKRDVKLVEKGTFKMSALEFGGTFQCNADKKLIGRLRGRMPEALFQ